MGTLLYDRGVFLTHCYDELNLSRPALIKQLHQEYFEAGAEVLETNTFGANRLTLAKHGHSAKFEDINRAGVALLREVVADNAYVAGSVGPTGVAFGVATASDRRLACDALRDQMTVLADAGVDLLSLETFTSIVELEEAIDIAVQTKLPVVAQLVFDASGVAEGGLTPESVAERLVAAGAHVVGANCGMGPPELYNVASKMVGHGAPVIVQPNAGLPSKHESRTIYVANPEHFGVFARRILKSGVRMIGGCCGTTPAHTRAMLGAVRMMSGSTTPNARISSSSSGGAGAVPHLDPIVPFGERSRLAKRIDEGTFAVSVELTSPGGTNATKFVDRIKVLLDAGIDVVNIADGPRATARMGNLASCAKAHISTGVEPILHVCCRDRNYLGLVAHLLGAHGLGMRNLVIITGDPPKMGDYPFATPVYDVDSVGLLEIAAGLNAGIDPAGKQLNGHTSFLLATGAEPAATDYDRELRRIELKKAAGAELLMTQPVYDPRTLERFLTDVEPMGLPVMVGLLPLASFRNAEFLHNEVPGMSIPAEYRERMAKVGSGVPARAEGVRIAQEALDAVKHKVAGAYIMPPFNRVQSAIEIMEVAKDLWTPAAHPDPVDL